MFNQKVELLEDPRQLAPYSGDILIGGQLLRPLEELEAIYFRAGSLRRKMFAHHGSLTCFFFSDFGLYCKVGRLADLKNKNRYPFGD